MLYVGRCSKVSICAWRDVAGWHGWLNRGTDRDKQRPSSSNICMICLCGWTVAPCVYVALCCSTAFQRLEPIVVGHLEYRMHMCGHT